MTGLKNVVINSSDRNSEIAWWVIGFILLASAFTTLELRQPNYFTQDDALIAEAPGMLEGCRSVWSGVWPDYDPIRYMGGPLAGEGFYSLTYPPTYLAYAIARHVLGNEYSLLEVFAAIHLLAGYCVMFWLCRQLGMRGSLACAATLSFLLSGSILVMGRSWHTFIPIVLWLPVLMVATIRWAGGPVTWRWALGAGLASAVLYHVGFPQIWIYCHLPLFAVALVMTLTGRVPWRAWGSLLAAGVVAAGFILPLVIPQFLATRNLWWPVNDPAGITYQWIAAVLPYPLVQVNHPDGWGSTDVQYIGHLFYFGGVFAVLFVAAAIQMLTKHDKRAFAANPWVLAAIFVSLLAMGRAGGIAVVLAQLPGLRELNDHPYRALPVFVCFAVIAAGVALEQWMPLNRNRAVIAAILALLTIASLFQHIWNARSSFYDYGFHPYPQLAVEEERLLHSGGRMASWSPLRSIAPGYAESLPHDLPMVYGVPSFTGYDPILAFAPQYLNALSLAAQNPLKAMRAYGVRWHLLSRQMFEPTLSPNPAQLVGETTVRNRELLEGIEPALTSVARLPNVLIESLDHTDALAFISDDPGIALPIQFDGSGLTTSIVPHSATASVILSFLWWPQMRASVDGKAAACSPDQWGRIEVPVPAGATKIHVRYADQWTQNILIGLLIAGIALLAHWQFASDQTA